jgi:hypothetical protein
MGLIDFLPFFDCSIGHNALSSFFPLAEPERNG